MKKHYDYYSILLYIQQYIEYCQRINTIYCVVAINRFLQRSDQDFLGDGIQNRIITRSPGGFMAHEFDGKKYEKASAHQKEWCAKLISELSLKGDERVLDLGCGDGTITARIAELVPNGEVVGIDSSTGMIDVAKSNGINPKEALTTEETIEHCKKGIPNVGYNISWGVIKCLTKADTPIALYKMDMHSLVVGTVTKVLNPLKKPAQFVCMTQETFFSVVDEDFTNCLTGLDSGLNNE